MDEGDNAGDADLWEATVLRLMVCCVPGRKEITHAAE